MSKQCIASHAFTELPPGVRQLVALAPFLRQHGFAVAPEQLINFLSAAYWLEARSMEAMRLAGRATLAPPPERLLEFDRLFRLFFSGKASASATRAHDELHSVAEPQADDSVAAGLKARELKGTAASNAELLAVRPMEARVDSQLRQFASAWVRRRPERKGFRSRRSKAGTIDLRNSLRQLSRYDGDVLELRFRRRQPRTRRVLVLIDISGSMKQYTEEYLRLAHTLLHATPRVEVLCIGTRLTSITDTLRERDLDSALKRASDQVADWDGGTRIGPALAELLENMRYVSFVRGAVVLMLSDGLEPGTPSVLVDAVARLARLCWRLVWATPLAADPQYRPYTPAMRAMLPHLSDLVDGASQRSLLSFLLGLRRTGEPAAVVWAAAKQ